MKVCYLISLFSLLSIRAELPIWPTSASHPSSQVYQYSFSKESYSVENRDIVVYRPIAIDDANKKSFPVIVYGHAQGIGLEAYEKTFIHLAKKGIAIIFPQYDKGFFDRDWRRMGRDYVNLSADALKRYSSFNAKELVYSGHSKGAFIALMAAATPKSLIRARSLLLFSPSGFDEEYLQDMDPSIRLSVIWANGDNVVAKESLEELVSKSPAYFKQFIEVGSYKNFIPGHFYNIHTKNLFGGLDGVHAYHFYGAWPWAYGAAKSGGSDYLYGDLVRDMGVSNNAHIVSRYGRL